MQALDNRKVRWLVYRCNFVGLLCESKALRASLRGDEKRAWAWTKAAMRLYGFACRLLYERMSQGKLELTA